MKQRSKQILLAPAAAIYRLLTTVRNKCYDWGVCASIAFPFPVISIGNITVGGTGKTPHTEKVVAMLRDKRKIAVLSRGYKRTTRAFRYVSPTDAFQAVGDEPLQIKRKFPDIPVAVDRRRVDGIRRLKADDHAIDVVILDDAFQHRQVRPALSILLIDYSRPLWDDALLPLGRLRESSRGAMRADVIIVTKCPGDLSFAAQQTLAARMPRNLFDGLFFTTIVYGEAVPVFPDADPAPAAAGECLLLTGVANPAPLVDHLTATDRRPLAHLAFADHHAFTPADVHEINSTALRYPRRPFYTTEKDAMRLLDAAGLSDDVRQRLYYIPITVRFLSTLQEVIFKNRLMAKIDPQYSPAIKNRTPWK
ncbi:MAG: tetraacyldisaccharide 4'-kinase [Prevotellaceae bacterium]|jgi:tetraacyldisaccharide 4'-kinase|nr:tetraacyldisaccharide 4'-kinase [Prevotellaceae bacterium]